VRERTRGGLVASDPRMSSCSLRSPCCPRIPPPETRENKVNTEHKFKIGTYAIRRKITKERYERVPDAVESVFFWHLNGFEYSLCHAKTEISSEKYTGFLQFYQIHQQDISKNLEH
jgi:hypothetical protein